MKHQENPKYRRATSREAYFLLAGAEGPRGGGIAARERQAGSIGGVKGTVAHTVFAHAVAARAVVDGDLGDAEARRP